MTKDLPSIDREYVEIYPVNWRLLSKSDVISIMDIRSFDEIREITLYLHIPFCPEICAFCGFNKVLYREDLYKDYVSAIASEIRYYKDHPDLSGRIVTAVYFGGGTASVLTPYDLEFLVDLLRDVFPIAPGCEFSVESHPRTLDEGKLVQYAKAGVNRLSIGVQSFSDRKLRAIGRQGSATQNEEVVRVARDAGIEKLSIDLMYRTPHETKEELRSDIAKVCELQPDNVSCYRLIVEGTGFERALPTLPLVPIESEMFALIQDILTSHGYEQWSKADFCKPQGITRYNLNYWRAPQTLLLGLGAGSHSHYFGGYAWVNVYSVLEYIDAIKKGCFPGTVGQPVSTKELMHRYMVMGVHCLSVDKAPFKQLFGLSIREVFERELEEMIDYGWIQETQDQVEMTRLGHLYANNIAQKFFSAECRGKVQPWSRNLQKLQLGTCHTPHGS